MFKNTHIWFPSYVSGIIKQRSRNRGERTIHFIFCVVDHFEPRVGGVALEKELERVESWTKGYTRVITQHKDSLEQKPKHTLFYPIDEYSREVFGKIDTLCKNGLGEIEVHLHHQNDTAASLKEKLTQAVKVYSSYGHLAKNKLTGKTKFGFIHGNWALDNSRNDGKWCGVNNELQILAETGCYADFTLPSAPSDTQTRKINSIYYAKDDPLKSKSHNTGKDVTVDKEQDDDLMIIQGPLALNWKRRKFGILPKIENAEITLENPPTPDRVDLWIRQHIHVQGRPEWVFVKVHTHGAQDKNLTEEYFRNLDNMYSYLEKEYNDGDNYLLHYVTARELYNIVKAAEAGESENPGKLRDYLLVGNH